ncbi:hypothetical protein [Marinobacterium litorale]|uniref:hypothetical protein n=1 Tax=Marinobacterium litorale TaxID=404770 RepID=UPI000407F9D9|nr:hypothetical protein [Marinobacterium litorale]
MTDTIREQIVKAVMCRLESLTTMPILRREQYADEDVFVCVWDQDQTSERNEYGQLTHSMPVVIEYVRQTDDIRRDAPTAEYAEASGAMYAELITTLFNDADGVPDPTLGDLAESMTETGMIPFTPEPGSSLIGCALQIEIQYHTRNGNPFQS